MYTITSYTLPFQDTKKETASSHKISTPKHGLQCIQTKCYQRDEKIILNNRMKNEKSRRK